MIAEEGEARASGASAPRNASRSPVSERRSAVARAASAASEVHTALGKNPHEDKNDRRRPAKRTRRLASPSDAASSSLGRRRMDAADHANFARRAPARGVLLRRQATSAAATVTRPQRGAQRSRSDDDSAALFAGGAAMVDDFILRSPCAAVGPRVVVPSTP